MQPPSTVLVQISSAERPASPVGATLGDAKLGRFWVAPMGAEVTGITETADGRTLFVNIQHPGELSKPLASGEAPQSVWPGNQGYGVQGSPRS